MSNEILKKYFKLNKYLFSSFSYIDNTLNDSYNSNKIIKYNKQQLLLLLQEDNLQFLRLFFLIFHFFSFVFILNLFY